MDLGRLSRLGRKLGFWLSLLVTASCSSGSSDEPTSASQTSGSQQSALVSETTLTLTLPLGVTKEAVTLAANGSLLVDDRTTVRQGSSATGVISNASSSGITRLGPDAQSGDVRSLAPVTLQDRSRVTGSVVSATTITTGNGVQVTGGVVQNAVLTPLNSFSWTVMFPSTTNGDVLLEPEEQRALDPGRYGAVTVKPRASLALRSGVYQFDSFDVEPEALVSLNETLGPVIIYVRSSFIYRARFSEQLGAHAGLLVGYLGTNTLFLEAPFAGTVVAPFAKIELGSLAAGHSGSFFARDVEVRPGTTVTHRAFPWDLIFTPPSVPPPAAVDPPTPATLPPPGFVFPNLTPIVGAHGFSGVSFGADGIVSIDPRFIATAVGTATASPTPAAAPSGTTSCTGSYVDNLSLSYVHEATDYATSRPAEQSSCAGCSTGRAAESGGTPAATELTHLTIRRIHKPRLAAVWSSFGPGVFANFDNKLDITTTGGATTIRSFDVDRDTDGTVWMDVDPSIGDNAADGVFHNALGIARSLELRNASGQLVNNPAQAATAVLTTHAGEKWTFEIILTDAAQPTRRAGRVVRFQDRNQAALTFAYRFPANASDTTLGGQRTRLWQLSSVTDMYGVSASIQYAAGLVNGRWVVSQIDLPNATAVRYTYSTSKPGGGVVGPALDRVEFPDGSSSTFATSIDPSTGLLIVHFDDNAVGGNGRRKDVYLTQATMITPTGQVVAQPTNLVRQIANGDGEVTYANWEDPNDSNTLYVYEGGGSLIRLVVRNGNVPVSYSRATSFDPRTQNPWTATFTGTEMFDVDDKLLVRRKSDAVERRIVWTRDPVTRAVNAVSFADGSTQTFSYNSFRLPTRVVDRAGQTFDYAYDSRGNLLTQTVGLGSPRAFRVATTYNSRGQPLTVTDANGNVTSYAYDARGFLLNVQEPADRAGGPRPVTAYEHDAIGRLSATVDADGRRLTFAYDARNRLTRVTYPDGTSETLVYGTGTSANLLVSHRDRNGNNETFSYDRTGRLVARTLAAGRPEAVVESRSYWHGTTLLASETRRGETTSYQYDSKKRLLAVSEQPSPGVALISRTTWDVVGRRVSSTDAYGRSTFYVYDANDRFARIIRERIGGSLPESPSLATLPRPTGANPDFVIEETVYRPTGEIAGRIDRRGIVKLNSFDPVNRVTEVIEAAGTPAEAKTQRQYDAQGNVTRELRPRTFKEGRPFATDFTYTGRNQIASKTEAAGSADAATETRTYTNTGKVRTQVDPRGGTTTFAYDVCCNRLASETDALGKTIRYTHDPNGNVVTTTDRNGNASSATFDGLNRRTSFTNGAGETTTTTYDDNLTDGQGLELAFAAAFAGLPFGANADGSAELTTNPLGETSLLIKDGLGRKLRLVDGNGNATTYAYDAVVDGLVETTTIDARGFTTRVRKDGQDLERESVDEEGFVTRSWFDAAGQRLARIDPNGTGTSCVLDERSRPASCTDANGATTAVTYDAEGNAVAVTDALGRSVQCVFDTRNRATRCTDRLGNVRSSVYDRNSNIVEVSDAEAQITRNVYDARNMLVAQTAPDTGRVSMTYDAGQRLATRTDESGAVVRFQYDRADRLIGRIYPDGLNDTLSYDRASRFVAGASARYGTAIARAYDRASRLLSEDQTLTGTTHTVGYAYDAKNHRTSVTYPDGSTVGLDTTPRGLISEVAIDGQILARRTFDPGRRLVQSTLGNGLVETTSYATDNQISQISVPGVVDLRYTYDANKRKTDELDALRPTDAQRFAYDAEGRVTTWNRGQTDAQTWSLSAEGDFRSTTRNGVTETRTHAAAHELAAIGSRTLSYDAKGNLTNDASGVSYAWDFDNRLARANLFDIDNPNRRADYAYDVFGRRLGRTLDGVTTFFVHDGAQLIAEYEGANLARKYVFANQVDEPIALITAAGTFFYTSNHLRTVMALSDATGAVVERYRYDAYGARTILDRNGVVRAESAVGNQIGFTGRYHDPETKLIFFRTRYYSPSFGRFISRDSNVIDGLSLYAAYFVPNQMDPTGAWSIGGVISSVGGAIVEGAKDVGGAIASGAKDVGSAIVDGAKDAGGAVVDGLKAIGSFLLDTPFVIKVSGDIKVAFAFCEGQMQGTGNLEVFVGFKFGGGAAHVGLSKEFSGELFEVGFPRVSCPTCGPCCRPGLGGINLAGDASSDLIKPLKAVLDPLGVECEMSLKANLCEGSLGVACFANLLKYVPLAGPALVAFDAAPGVKLEAGLEIGAELATCFDTDGPKLKETTLHAAAKVELALGED